MLLIGKHEIGLAGTIFEHSSNLSVLPNFTDVLLLQNFCLESNSFDHKLLVWDPKFNGSHARDVIVDPISNEKMIIENINITKQKKILALGYHLIPEENIIFKRNVGINFYHWQQLLFGLWRLIEHRTTDPIHVFHIPTNSKFVHAANMSYFQLVRSLGVSQQTTVDGILRNYSSRHADEVRSGNRTRFVCFRRGVMGSSGRILGNPLSLRNKKSFQDYAATFMHSFFLPPSGQMFCPPRVLLSPRQFTKISRPEDVKRKRHLANIQAITLALAKLGVNFQVIDLHGMKIIDQLRLASQSTVFAAAHGQGLWLIPFLPKFSTVVEVLPYGFPYLGYRNLALSSGILDYHQLVSPVSNTTLPYSVEGINSILRRSLNFSEEEIEAVNLNLKVILRRHISNYTAITKELSKLGFSPRLAKYHSKIYAREQELAPNLTHFIKCIQDATIRQTQYCKTRS